MIPPSPSLPESRQSAPQIPLIRLPSLPRDAVSPHFSPRLFWNNQRPLYPLMLRPLDILLFPATQPPEENLRPLQRRDGVRYLNRQSAARKSRPPPEMPMIPAFCTTPRRETEGEGMLHHSPASSHLFFTPSGPIKRHIRAPQWPQIPQRGLAAVPLCLCGKQKTRAASLRWLRYAGSTARLRAVLSVVFVLFVLFSARSALAALRWLRSGGCAAEKSTYLTPWSERSGDRVRVALFFLSSSRGLALPCGSLRWLRYAGSHLSVRIAGLALSLSLRVARSAGYALLILRSFVRPLQGRNIRYALPRDSLRSSRG